jgi:RNA polymerase sigma-70 factor (ECF subfamily)
MSPTDPELVAECRGGRQSAFGELVLRHQNRLFHSVRQLLHSSEEAQDVCQEAFLKAYQKLGEFEGRSSFYSWLFRISRWTG